MMNFFAFEKSFCFESKLFEFFFQPGGGGCHDFWVSRSVLTASSEKEFPGPALVALPHSFGTAAGKGVAQSSSGF